MYRSTVGVYFLMEYFLGWLVFRGLPSGVDQPFQGETTIHEKSVIHIAEADRIASGGDLIFP